MISHNREHFLSSFFAAFGADKVKWTNIFANYIAGTIFFSGSDSREPQDFHWEMTEREAPGGNALSLVEFLDAQNLLSSGRLIKPAGQIEVPELDEQQKEKAFGELFDVRVRMVPGRDLVVKAALPRSVMSLQEHVIKLNTTTDPSPVPISFALRS